MTQPMSVDPTYVCGLRRFCPAVWAEHVGEERGRDAGCGFKSRLCFISLSGDSAFDNRKNGPLPASNAVINLAVTVQRHL